MPQTLSGFIYQFIPGENPSLPPLLLLHGTGGNENDMVPLGHAIAPGAAMLSPRGTASEAGMPRFFRRIDEGVFDRDDLDSRTDELATFVREAVKQHGLAKPIAVGFSNGANIAWSLLLQHPEVLAGAVLMRAMLPFDPPEVPDLKGVPVLILSGASDELVPATQRDRLAKLLTDAGAAVSYQVLPTGHGLIQDDVAIVKRWIAQRQT
jgi:phospholipase/carboxylesterase